MVIFNSYVKLPEGKPSSPTFSQKPKPMDSRNGQVFETRRMELLRDIREVNSAIRAAELRKRRKPLVSSIFRIEDT